MALKYSFKLFLRCIFKFMINTAPQGSNSVNGRDRMAQWYEAALSAM